MLIIGVIIVLLIIVIGVVSCTNVSGRVVSKVQKQLGLKVVDDKNDIIQMPRLLPEEEDFAEYRVSELNTEASHKPPPVTPSPMTLVSALRQISKDDITDEGCVDIEQNLDKYRDNNVFNTEAQPTY